MNGIEDEPATNPCRLAVDATDDLAFDLVPGPAAKAVLGQFAENAKKSGGIEITAADKETVHAMIRAMPFAAKMALCVSPVRIYEIAAQHRIAARNAALAEAAKVAEEALLWDSGDPSRVVATAIRTLSTQDTPDMRATNKGDE